MIKSVKYFFIIFVCVITLLPVNTIAKSLNTLSGIEISEEDYNNFLKIHSEEYIMTMNEEKYLQLKSYDYSNVITDTKYIITTYDSSLGLTTVREITEEEYNEFEPNTRNVYTDSTYYESNAKRISLALIASSDWNYVTLTATWKYIPSTRSFDVIGFRGSGFQFRNGSQTGQQIYYLGGSYNVINYSWNGTNIKKFTNGFGISMNIVNSSISTLQLEAECDVKQNASTSEIYGSYQHAVTNLTLANSQNYTLGSVGLGGVFVYPSNISSKYDGMNGVHLTYY